MNQTVIIVIGVILFALVTAGIYAVGLRKKIHEEERLTEMLLNNGALRVKNYLKEHDTVTEAGIGYIIEDVQAKEFHSRKTAVIADGQDFQKQLIPYMLRHQHIVRVKGEKGETLYALKQRRNSNE